MGRRATQSLQFAFKRRPRLLQIRSIFTSLKRSTQVNKPISPHKYTHTNFLFSRLMQVGEEFCASKSEDLQESIRKQSGNYFNSYHQQRLEELKIFLENESWEICPVKPTFHILQLQEFKGLRHALRTNYVPTSPDCSSSNHSQDGSSIIGNYFIRFAEHGTPFDARLNETIIDEDILVTGDEASGYFSEDSEEEAEELRRDFVDEYADEQHQK